MKKVNLKDAPSHVELEVIEIDAGMGAKKRLISLGVHSGDKLIKFDDPFWGPVLIKNITLDSTKIAIGKGLAKKIIVGFDET